MLNSKRYGTWGFYKPEDSWFIMLGKSLSFCVKHHKFERWEL